MKTIAKTLLAAAAAVAGSATTASAGSFGEFGGGPDGYRGTTIGGYAGSSCSTGACLTGDCGLAGCATCDPRMGRGYGGTAARPAFDCPYTPQTSARGAYTPTTNLHYVAKPAVAYPHQGFASGVRPQPSYVGYAGTGYRPQIAPGGCTTGNCPAPAARRPVSQAPRFNFLGLNW